MKTAPCRKVFTLAFSFFLISGYFSSGVSQPAETLEDILSRVPSAPPGIQAPPIPEHSLVYPTGEGFDIEVSFIATGLNHPWSMVMLPDNSILVTERNSGQLRLIKNGNLQQEPLDGMPAVSAASFSGLHDIVLHPDFETNQQIYLSYVKPLDDGLTTLAVMRATLDGNSLKDQVDIFMAGPGVGSASRLLFANDGMLYVSVYGSDEKAQQLDNFSGKILRLTKDGGIPEDNPFVNTPNARPEIFTYGHRTTQGLIQHPVTGEIWQLEMGPNGGDEINILKAGANYGWPQVSLGRDYAGPWQGEFSVEGMQNPSVYWMPSISVSGMVFYTGDKLPQWQGDLIVGGLRMGEIPGTGQIHRVRFNALGEEIRREALLQDMHYRIRGAHQGNDGYLYVLTDEDNGALIRIGAAQ